MVAEVDTIASNVTRLAIRRDAATEWLLPRPKSYADFGAEVEKEENQVIEPGRNREKEVAVGVSAPGGFKLKLHAGILRPLRRWRVPGQRTANA